MPPRPIAARHTVVTALATLLAAGISHADPGGAAAPAPAPAAVSLPRLQIDGPFGSQVRLEIANRLRGEFVSWFETPETGPTPDDRYDFVGNKFQAGVRWIRDPVEAFVQVENALLTNLPTRGVGVGASYFANTRYTPQNGVFLRNGWLKWRNPLDLEGFTVTAGRQLYADGFDVPATDATLRWVQVNRIGQRLLGPFDYTHVGRSFDGGRVAFDTEDVNVTAFGFVPTRGGFEVHANGDMDIVVAGGSVNLKDSPAVTDAVGRTIARVFHIYYQDDRDLVFLDNRPLPLRRADEGRAARIHTVGASAIHVEPFGPGNVDVMAYGFGQVGAWQSQDQRSYAFGAEVGYQLVDLPARPWLRLGFNQGSGDRDPTDDTHATFFQLLPTAWLYAQFPFYNMMNNQDAFAQLVLEPHPRVTLRWDVLHWLRTSSSRDLVYFGGGATKNDFFGYGSTGSSQGRHELALLTHLQLTVRPIDPLSIGFFYAHAWGQAVIGANFEGRPADYGFIEATFSY